MTIEQKINEVTMTKRQAIRSAAIIMVPTKHGSVRITKKEALKYVRTCEERGHEINMDCTEIYDGKYLVIVE